MTWKETRSNWYPRKKEFLFWDQFRVLVVNDEDHRVAEIEHLFIQCLGGTGREMVNR